MDPNTNNPRDVTPHRPTIGMPAHRPVQRPVFNDFTARPSAALSPSMRPARPSAAVPQPAAPTPVTTPTAPAVPVSVPVAQPSHHTPHHVAPQHHVPATTPAPQPIAQPRPVAPAAPQMDGFLRPAAPVAAAQTHTPAAASQPTYATPQPQHHAVAHPSAAAPQPAPRPAAPVAHLPQATAQSSALNPVDSLPVDEAQNPTPEHGKAKAAKAPRPRSETAHAGLVGFITFLLLTAAFVLPLLPGKVLDNFPGSSASFSTGDQSLACLDQLENQHTSTSYDSKAGFPITYRYATSTHQTATCDGKTQTAITGHTSQFNPLGLAINVVSALVVAIIVGKVWGKLFGRRD